MPKTSRQPTALSGLAEYRRRHYSSGLDARTAFRFETWSTVAVGMQARRDITVALKLRISPWRCGGSTALKMTIPVLGSDESAAGKMGRVLTTHLSTPPPCRRVSMFAGVTAAGTGGGGGGVFVLMAVLPVVHLLSLACLDAASRLPFLKVGRRTTLPCGATYHRTLLCLFVSQLASVWVCVFYCVLFWPDLLLVWRRCVRRLCSRDSVRPRVLESSYTYNDSCNAVFFLVVSSLPLTS